MYTFPCRSNFVKLLIQHRLNKIQYLFDGKISAYVCSKNNLFKK